MKLKPFSLRFRRITFTLPEAAQAVVNCPHQKQEAKAFEEQDRVLLGLAVIDRLITRSQFADAEEWRCILLKRFPGQLDFDQPLFDPRRN